MLKHPIVVYLDAQDYIKIFNERSDGPNHAVLARLMEARDRKDIAIGYSFATMLEFITKPDFTNRQERVRRGELIKDICGGNAFPYLTDLAAGASFPNGGRWMIRADKSTSFAKEFKARVDQAYKRETAKLSGLNRKSSRALRSSSGKREFIRKTSSTWGRRRSDWGDFPVSDELIESGIVSRFLQGQCSDAAFDAAIYKWLHDPAEFSRIAYDYMGKPNLIRELFGDTIEKIALGVSELQNAAAGLQRIREEATLLRKKLKSLGLQDRAVRSLVRMPNISQAALLEQEKRIEAAVGFQRAGHFIHYLQRASNPGFRFKCSDVMDLMQMCYAYDCDLFRCDKAMANMFANFKPFRGKLVERFEELPERIDKLLEAARTTVIRPLAP